MWNVHPFPRVAVFLLQGPGRSAGALVLGAGMWSDRYGGDPARNEPAPLWAWLDCVPVEPHYGDRGRLIRQRPGDFPDHIVLGIPNRGAALVLTGREEVEALGPEPLSVHTAPDSPPVIVPVGQRYRLPT